MFRALSIVVNEGRQLLVPLKAQPVERTKLCPHCRRERSIQRDFGMRVVGNKPRPQSWCRDCRRGTEQRTAVAQLELIAI